MIFNALAYIYKQLHFSATKVNNYKLVKHGLLQVGNDTYGTSGLSIITFKGCDNKVIIGNYCSIASNVKIICGGIHPTNYVSTFPFRIKFDLSDKYTDGHPSTKGDVIIGNDVWIGTEVTILSGVSIGNGAIIFANSVVTKDVPDYAIVTGVPAKIIRYRFSEEEICHLNKIKWWEWNKDKLIDNVELFSSPNIELFLKKHKI